MPLLSIVTRCYKRPIKLKVNITSVASQTNRDWEQVFITDDEGRGMLWANQSLYHNRHRVNGNYVFILDDDDCMTYDDFVEDLKGIVSQHAPAVIMVKADQILRTLPTDLVWKQEKYPIIGQLGTGNFIVRNDLWQRHIESFGKPNAGDYSFICDVFDTVIADGEKIYWFDKIVMRAQKVSYGKPEE